MKKYVLQALFILCGILVFPGCSDDDNDVDLTKLTSAAAALPSKLAFSLEQTQAAVVDLSVALSAPAPETVSFEAKIADDSEVGAESVSFSRDHFAIESGRRSFELTCTVEANAVEAGESKKLCIDFISLNANVKNLKLEIVVAKESGNTIVHVSGLELTIALTGENWQAIELDGNQIAGLFRNEAAIGSAPKIVRLHLENNGGDIIGTQDGDVINLTPLAKDVEVGSGSAWVTNPEYSDDNWMYIPVLYSEVYKDWVGKTAYAGIKIQGYNYWFKFTVTAEAEFTLTEFAYQSEKGESIRTGQTDSKQ